MKKYDEYYSKVKKKATLTKNLYRFRILIISLLTLFTVSLTGFLISKGTITKDAEIKPEFVYGEDITLSEPQALFSSCYYQYSEIGKDNWSEEKPTIPGKYQVRVSSNGSFGIKRHSKPVEFTINKKDLEFELLNSNITYGSNPNFNFTLVSGDTAEVKYEYKDYANNKTVVVATITDIKNDQGNSVLELYEIPTIEQEIEFTKKDISLSIGAINKIYDGEKATVNTERISDSLAFDDELKYELDYFVKNDEEYTKIDYIPNTVGEYAVAINKDSLDIKKGEISTLANYDINEASFDKIKYSISSRNINVITGSASKEYDGKPLTNDEVNDCSVDVNSEYGLLEGHSLEFIDSNNEDYINANTYKNKIVLGVVDKDGNDMTNNYNLNYTYGDLVIDKFALSVKPFEVESYTYDGSFLDYQEYISKNPLNYVEINNRVLPNNEEIFFNYKIQNNNDEVISNPRNVDLYNISFNGVDTVKTLVDLNNYDINYDTTSFEIKKKPLKVKPKILDGFVYDSKDHIIDFNNEIKNNFFEFLDKTSLAENDSLLLDFKFLNSKGEEVTQIINADTYSIYIKGLNSESDINLDNYAYDFDGFTKFEVLPREITLTPDLSDYNNQQYGNVKVESTLKAIIDSSKNIMLNNDNLELQVKYFNTNGENITNIDAANAGVYTVAVDKYLVNGKENNNYSFVYDNKSTYEILKRKIHVDTVKTLEYIYGNKEIKEFGKELTLNENIIGINMLPNEKIVLNVHYMNGEDTHEYVKHVGTYDIIYDDFKVVGGNKDNYEIVYDNEKPETITINKKEITYIKNDLTDKIYDGQSTELKNNVNIFFEGLENNDQLSIEFDITKKNAEGTYDKVEFAKNKGDYLFKQKAINIFDENNTNVTNDYDLSSIETLEIPHSISRKKVGIKPKNKTTSYYYGDVIKGIEWEPVDVNNTFVEGDVPNFIFTFDGIETTDIVEIGDYIVDISYDYENSNYAIEFSKYAITIKPLELVITPTGDLETTYSGLEQGYTDVYNTFTADKEIPNGDQIYLSFKYNNSVNKPINAGTYPLTLDIENCDLKHKDGVDSVNGIANYKLTLADNYNFVIKKHDLGNITAKSYGDVPYDGNFKDYYNEYPSDTLVKGVNGEQFKISYSYSCPNGNVTPKDVGEYTVKLNSLKEIDKGSLANYTYKLVNSTFEIFKAKVNITLPEINSIVYNGLTVNFNQIIKVDGLIGEQNIDASRAKVMFTDLLENVKANKFDLESVKNVGTYYYTVDLDSLYVGNKKLTENYDYELNKDYASFDITRRVVDVVVSQVYDKEFNKESFRTVHLDFAVGDKSFALSNESIQNINPTFYKVVEGTRVDITNLDTIMNVGNYYFEVKDKDLVLTDSSMKTNYKFNITIDDQVFNIYKKNINVNVELKDKPNISKNPDYNKNIIQNITYGDTSYLNSDVNVNLDTSLDVKLDYNISFTNENNETTTLIKNAGKYKININNLKIDDVLNNPNYNIIYTDEYININRKNIVLNLDKKIKQFNGKVQYYNEKNNIVNIKGLDGDNFNISFDVLKENETSNVKEKSSLLHSGTYDLQVKNVESVKGSISNYYINNETDFTSIIFSDIYSITKLNLYLDYNFKDYDYDGKFKEYEIKDNNFMYKFSEGDRLIEGHTITIKPQILDENGNIIESGKIKNFGKYKLHTPKENITFNDPKLVDDYNIFLDDHVYSINKRNITVGFKDANIINGKIEYNGLEYNYPTGLNNFIDVNNRLIDGDGFEISILSDSVIKDAGKYVLDITYGIDANNYDVTFKPYTLEITKKNVTITFDQQQEYIFNGHPIVPVLTNDKNGLIGDDTIEDSYIYYKDGVQTENCIDAGKYTIGYDASKVKNYNIKLANNLFEIKKRIINLENKNYIKEYDGKKITKFDDGLLDKFVSSTDEIYLEFKNEVKIDLTIPEDNQNCGRYPVTINNITHKNFTFNYNKQCEIIVNKRRVTLELENNSYNNKTYDGNGFEKEELDAIFKKIKNNPLVGDDNLKYELMFYDTIRGELISNSLDVKNAGSYNVLINPNTVEINSKAGSNSLENYDITYLTNYLASKASINIKKADIILEVKNQKHVYDGQIHEYTGTDKDLKLNNLYGNTIKEITYTYKPTNANVQYFDYVDIESYKLFDANGNEAEKDPATSQYRNFSISTRTGTYEITKRKIDLYGIGYTYEYDGLYHYADKIGWKQNASKDQGLVNGHKLSVDLNDDGYIDNTALKDASNQTFNQNFVPHIYDEKDIDVIDNYDYTILQNYEDSRMVITRRKITVTIYKNTLSNVTELVQGENFELENSLCPGENIKITLVRDIEEPAIRRIKIEILNGQKSNYQITIKKVIKGGL